MALSSPTKALFLLCLLGLSSFVRGWTNPEVALQIEQRIQLAGTACTLAAKYGYPCQVHEAPTDDGWILTLHRIPYGKTPVNTTRGVVLFNHGLMDSSSGIALNTPELNLALFLADSGYDVWLSNNRGNGISMKNTRHSQNSDAYWDFSWADMALHDFPANVEYVSKFTGRNITYMGHSQGTIQAFAGLTSNHAIAKKLNLFIALAPVAFVGDIRVFLFQLLANLGVDKIFQFLGLREFWLPDFIQRFVPTLCGITPFICSAIWEFASGPFPGMDNSKVSFWLQYYPYPTSVKNMAHWAQSVRDGTFGMYDYGREGNLQRYGVALPPQFNLTHWPASLPVVLFTGTLDALSDPEDVGKLINLLPKPYIHNEINYGHLDFILGKYAPNIHNWVLNYLKSVH